MNVQVKSRQQAAWNSGDYAVIGTTLQFLGELLCEVTNESNPVLAL